MKNKNLKRFKNFSELSSKHFFLRLASQWVFAKLLYYVFQTKGEEGDTLQHAEGARRRSGRAGPCVVWFDPRQARVFLAVLCSEVCFDDDGRHRLLLA